MWRDYRAMVDAAPVSWSILFDIQFRWYSSSQVLAIRRLVDRDSRAISMENLLCDIAAAQSDPEPPLTRRWFVDVWLRELPIPEPFREHEATRASAAFDDLAGRDQPVMPAAAVLNIATSCASWLDQ